MECFLEAVDWIEDSFLVGGLKSSICTGGIQKRRQTRNEWAGRSESCTLELVHSKLEVYVHFNPFVMIAYSTLQDTLL